MKVSDASAWAARYLPPEPDLIDVTPREETLTGWYFAQASQHRVVRDAHARALRNRSLNATGAALLGAFVPVTWPVAWPVSIGWMIAAGVSLYGLVVAQIALSITADAY